jgi:hypothetical protein
VGLATEHHGRHHDLGRHHPGREVLAVKRRRIPKPAQGVCAHGPCSKFFVYFKITKTRMFCTQACATKNFNDYFNGLESAARRERTA